MKHFPTLALTAGFLLAAAAAASAMTPPPAPPSHTAGLIQVRDGCGHGYHMNRHGHCIENDDDRGWDDRRYRGDGCDRWHHRRHGRCVPNW